MRRPALILLLVALAVPRAQAADALFSLAIGHNGVPPGANGVGVGLLSFADDDALAVHELARTVARRSMVLALPDRATHARFRSALEARPPSLAELRRALADLKSDIARATAAGDETAVWLFYSGHGWLDEDGRANLTLADGTLTQDMLYDEVLPALQGRTVHLMIDACHAEALLRTRDLVAQTVEVPVSQVAAASLRRRLDQLPNVGAIMASASNTQAHEWDDYQTGIFTHELLSGLRGGADVNGDGRIEYSEIAAFLSAANRAVVDPRARLTTLVAPPKLYPRVPILDFRRARGVAHLRGRAHHLGSLRIDDRLGNRLIDLRVEAGFGVDLIVPAGEPVLLSNQGGERKVLPSSHAPTDLEAVALDGPRPRPRSATTESLRRGLFAAEFGPSYYGGFVDSPGSKMVPVELVPAGLMGVAAAPAHHRPRAAWAAFAVAGASAVAAGVFAVLAARAYADFQDTSIERSSYDAHRRFELYRAGAIGAAAAGAVAGALGAWMWRSEDAVAGSPIHPEESR
jgi:hypothetical protein